MIFREYLVQLQHDRGHVRLTVPATSPLAAVTLACRGEGAPLRAVRHVWMRPVCEMCVGNAVRYIRDTVEETPLCWSCACQEYPSSTEMRAHTGTLGTSRFLALDTSEWGGQPRVTIKTLTRDNVSAVGSVFPEEIRAGAVEVDKRTVTFFGPGSDILKLVDDGMARAAVQFGVRGHPYQSLHAVVRKLNAAIKAASVVVPPVELPCPDRRP